MIVKGWEEIQMRGGECGLVPADAAGSSPRLNRPVMPGDAGR